MGELVLCTRYRIVALAPVDGGRGLTEKADDVVGGGDGTVDHVDEPIVQLLHKFFMWEVDRVTYLKKEIHKTL